MSEATMSRRLERLDGSDPADKPTFRSAKCPMPRCGADLYITWTASRPVWVDDAAADLCDPNEGYTSSWEVGCSQGHTVLLPPDTAADSYTFGECDGCPDSPDVQDPASAESCGHGDLERLREVIAIGPTDPFPKPPSSAVDQGPEPRSTNTSDTTRRSS